MTETIFAHALAWGRRGFGTFPLHYPVAHNGQVACSCGRLCGKPAKHPFERYAPNGCYSASTEPGVIKLWFQLRCPEANLGVHCDGLVVIDVDPRDGGDESLAKLEQEHGELPLTWRTLTGGGGEHIFFAAPVGVTVPNVVAKNEIKNGREPPLGPGIDTRSKGGYIVAPPSRHICGRSYAWSVDHHPANVQLAPAPEFLIERLTAARGTNGGTAHDQAQWAARKAGMISEYRDMAIAQVAGKLLCAVSLDPAFVATLVHDWNTCHCDPPLPEHEVQVIFNRICKKHRQRVEAGNAW